MLAGREFGKGATKGKAGWDDLKNSLVFTWGFVEMLVWFWVSDACLCFFVYSVLERSKPSDKRSGIMSENEKDTSDLICMDQIYVTLRDERREAAIVAADKKRTEEDRL